MTQVNETQVEGQTTPEGVCQWLAAMDEPGSSQRATVTLTQIIDAAKEALESAPESNPR